MDALQHVLWIGGPSGAGKTTIGRRIARRHGLRWYNSDAHTWEHRDRALAAGVPAAARWEAWRALPPDERPVVTPEEELAMGLRTERELMVADDLRALPTSPLILAEGGLITPRIAGAGGQAVWLLPSWELRRVRLEERGWAPGPDEPLAARLIAEAVEAAGARKVVVDRGTAVEDTVAEVERLFADSLDAGPRAQTVEERRSLLRYANRTTEAQVLGFFARPWAKSEPRTPVGNFVCECAQTDCDELVELPIADFPPPPDVDSSLVLAAGHRAEWRSNGSE